MRMPMIEPDDLRLFLTDGGFAVRTQAGVADALGLSIRTVHRYLEEMREEVGKRYPPYAIAEPSKNTVLVSTAAFWDFLCYRRQLKDKSLRDSVPPYDAGETLKGLGVSFTLVA